MTHRASVLHRWLFGAFVGTAALPLAAQVPAGPPPGPPATPAPAQQPAAAAAPATPAPAAAPIATAAPPLEAPPSALPPAHAEAAPSAAPAAAPAEKPKKPEAGRFEIASEDGAHRLEFKGLIQADARFFMTDKGGVSSFVLRRVRPSLDAKIFRYYEFRLQPDFAGTRVQILDAYGNLHFIDELQLRVGKGKSPVGLERLQSPRDMLFAERAFPTQLVPNRDIGAQLHGKIAGGLFEWAFGVYNGVPNGASGDADTNDSKDVEGRVFLLPFLGMDNEWLSGFGLGFAATWGNQFGPTPSYVTPGQQTFFSFTSGTSAFGERTVLAPQSYYYGGPISLMFELVRVKERLENLSTGVSASTGTTAWQLAGSVVLGGKPSYKGVKVTHAFDPEKGGYGAFELSARYQDLRTGDLAFERGFANPTSSAQRASAFGFGGTWHLANGYRAMVNYENTSFRGGARDGDRPTESVLISRLQASF